MANCNEERKKEELDKDREYIRKKDREKKGSQGMREIFQRDLHLEKKGQRKREKETERENVRESFVDICFLHLIAKILE